MTVLEQSQLDPHLLSAALRVLAVLKELPLERTLAGKPVKVYLVGGLVRDALLGTPSKDGDMEVFGVSFQELVSFLEEKFGKRNVNLVGEHFQVIKLNVGNVTLDVSLPRRDSKKGTGHKGFEVVADGLMSLKDAARRRDFTINSMMLDLDTMEIVDPFNGEADLRKGVLRMTDPKTFVEDPLRVLRAVQFHARFRFRVHRPTFELCKQMAQKREFKRLPAERVSEELFKLLTKSETPSIGFTLMLKMGFLEQLFRQVFALIGVKQEKQHHPEGDVFIHTMMSLDEAAKLARRVKLSQQDTVKLLLSVLGHDFGKPKVTKLIDGRYRALGHEEAGRKPVLVFAKKLKLSTELTEAMTTVAVDHLSPAMLYKNLSNGSMKEAGYNNAIRRLILRLKGISWEVFLLACEADSRGRTVPGCRTDEFLPGKLFRDSVLQNKLAEEAAKKLISGKDILGICTELGKEIPQKDRAIFGVWVKQIEDLRDTGEIPLGDEAHGIALELVRSWVSAY